MSLIKQFELKLEQIQSKLETTRKAFKYNSELVLYGLKTVELYDPLRNIFAKYNFALTATLIRIKNLNNELNIYSNHREIILREDKRIQRALELLETTEDKISDVLTTLQAMAIFLENLQKQ